MQMVVKNLGKTVDVGIRAWSDETVADVVLCSTPARSTSASEMTYIVSSGALNSTHSLTPQPFFVICYIVPRLLNCHCFKKFLFMFCCNSLS